ncbi:MAG TPA: hypothetical protein IAC20_04030 [Candidatus Faecisoma merdavium]|nr:hypothetical protein [Candidatus Faecisoma merdavium]
MDLDNEELEATRSLELNSIEEAIKRCKELIKPKHINWIGGTNQNAIKLVLSNLEILSNLQYSANREITESKKQNRELMDEYHQKVQEVIDLEQDIKILQDDFEDKRLVYIDTPEFQDSYIPKQKIKDKIYEIKVDKDSKYYYMFLVGGDIENTINILEELLKE